MTPEQLAACTRATPERAKFFYPYIDPAFNDFDINTPLRQAAWLAQIGHESGGLRYVKEIWGPTEAQQFYEVRKDLGNVQPGDGKRFMGRGLLQITGRDNYEKVSKALATDFVSNPEMLEEPDMAVRSAMWWWQMRGLNELADVQDFIRITLRVNGGTNGLAERQALYATAKKVLGA